MAKRYSSSFISESEGKHCNLPENVIMKDISKNEGFNQANVKDLYTFVTEQHARDKADIQRITKPEKF